MLIKVTVKDVNGAILSFAKVKAIYTDIGTSPEMTVKEIGAGDVLTVALALQQIELQVSAVNFEGERFLFAEIGQSWQANNLASTIAQQGDILDIIITLGIVRFASTVTLPPDHKLKENPRAVLVDDVGGGQWIYRGGRHNFETLRKLDEPIFGDLYGFEWERFNNSIHAIDLVRQGRFILLEYGPPLVPGTRNPRFLIAAWAPFKALSSTPEVVLFYSPPTFENRGYPVDSHPFTGDYPYAVRPFDPKNPKPVKDLFQPYIDITTNYVMVGYKIIYQLIAAGRNPILIMPSQPSAQWGPLSSQPGVARLIKEVLRFFYAKQLVSSLAGSFGRLSLSGGRSSIAPPEGRFVSEKVPTTFAATLSGFSAGINTVVSVCTLNKFNEKLYPSEFFYAPPSELMNNWREIWDIDGVDGEGWDHMVRTFRAWLRGSRRALRAYHSSTTYRASENGLVDVARIVRKPNKPVKGVYAEEGHSADERVTWVHFSDPSLLGDWDDPRHQKTIPEFGMAAKLPKHPQGEGFDAHHFVPAIAFGHAAKFPLP
jgi:hypothetical protein